MTISIGVMKRERNPDDRVHEEIVTAANGEEFFLKSTDPYGLWQVSKVKGNTPASLRSQFTSRNSAWLATKNYLDRIFEGIQEKPVLKRKNVKAQAE